MSETLLHFHHLTFVPERDGVMVGRPDTESYVVLPDEGAQLLRRLVGGMPVADAADWYRGAFGEDVDIADFVSTLQEIGFVRAPDETVAQPPRVRFQALGRALFSPPAWFCYLGVMVAAAVLVLRHPQLRPGAQNVLFSPSFLVVQFVVLASQVLAVLIHESFHALAGRRLGLPSRLRISFRLYFIVFETHLNGLLGVPRRRRYLPFFAGMLIDAVLVGGLILLAATGLHGDDGLPWPARLALAIAYTSTLRLVWQLFLFLRTDPYFALTTALGCTNLAEASSAYLRVRIRTLLGRPVPTADDEDSWTPRDRAIAPWFAWFTVAGTAALCALLAYTVVPIFITLIERLVSGLTHGGVGGLRFWDSTVTLAIPLSQFIALPLLVALRSRRERARPAAAPRPSTGLSADSR